VTAIRPATADDVGALAAIHANAVAVAYAGIFDAGVPPPTVDQLVGRWALLIATPGAWVGVAEDNGATVGMAGARPSPDPDSAAGTGEIVGLHVHPAWWGGGLGGTLFDAAVDAAGRLGLAPLRLWALQANLRARRLYERRGWQADGATKPIAPHVIELRYSLA
jgi:GNAT superfamily N-acetyltransferase